MTENHRCSRNINVVEMDATIRRVDQQGDRVTRSKYSSQLLQRNAREYPDRFITVEETWILHSRDERTVQTIGC